MLLDMTSTQQPLPALLGQRWGPAWAKALAWVALVPAALMLLLGMWLFIQGFGGEALAAVGFIVGSVLALLALLFAVPPILFLVLRGKPAFIVAMCTTGLYLVGVALYSF